MGNVCCWIAWRSRWPSISELEACDAYFRRFFLVSRYWDFISEHRSLESGRGTYRRLLGCLIRFLSEASAPALGRSSPSLSAPGPFSKLSAWIAFPPLYCPP